MQFLGFGCKSHETLQSHRENVYNFDMFSLCFRWFAKRFLHPDIVSDYRYIFLWDEDLDVQHLDPQRSLPGSSPNLYCFSYFYFYVICYMDLIQLHKNRRRGRT